MWQKMENLIGSALWGWIGQQFNSFYCFFKGAHGLTAHAQVSNHNTFRDNIVINRGVSERFQRDVCHSPLESKIWGSVEVNERSYGASNLSQGDYGDWRGFVGFVGRGGVPWLWEADKQCWLPVTESSRVAEYAALKDGLRSWRLLPPPAGLCRLPTRLLKI
jgi:hypothetical protein